MIKLAAGVVVLSILLFGILIPVSACGVERGNVANGGVDKMEELGPVEIREYGKPI